MTSESELRNRFRDGTPPSGQIDLDAVLRLARARRRPRAVLAAAGSVLAIAAIAVPATISSFAGPQSTADSGALVAGGSAESQPVAPNGDGTVEVTESSAENLNLCSAPVAEVAPATNGLVLTVEPVTAAAGDHDIRTIVTMTNTGNAPVSGTTGGRPTMTLAQDGLTLWHSNGPQTMIAVLVDLAPGESIQYPATFEPVACDAQDEADNNGSFREGLPRVDAGVYQLSAAIDFTGDDGSELVTGPAVSVTLN